MLDEKAKDLGRTIGQSTEYQTLKRAGDAVRGDTAASTIMDRLSQLQSIAREMIERGEDPPQAMEQELDTLMQKIEVNDVYQRVIVAQTNFDKLMVRVNEQISEGIRTGSVSKIISLS